MKHRIVTLLVGLLAGWTISFSAAAAPLSIATVPLFLPGSVAPLNMLVMGRDHTLFYEAYNDASDLNGDGTIDIGYKPAIDYYGYFDSYKCYLYTDSGSNSLFSPSRKTTTKKCGGANEWSGDFLNYLGTSRMDALRKVLYGGTRIVDGADETTGTILRGAFIPQDAHSWGKEYTSIAYDGYDIRDYTPYSEPNANRRHLFATVSDGNATNASVPRIRVALGRTQRIWEWVSKERPVSGGDVAGTAINAEFRIRVKVCVPGLLESNCREYTGISKPAGLLQEFGEGDRMYFGLMSGSYTNNLRGGVLRKNIESIKNEINATTGQFTAVNGIIRSIDTLRIIDFNFTDQSYSPGWPGAWITKRAITNGEQPNWGNPIGEILYETLRYFTGKGSATSSFVSGISNGDDKGLNLPLVASSDWKIPFNEYPSCSAPIALTISDVNPSYDTDDIPGSAFGSGFSGDLSDFDAEELGDKIWSGETGSTAKHFIGQSGSLYDGAPTPKEVTSFGNIRGLSPEAPAKEGGYYAASAAYYGKITDLSATAKDKQTLTTYSVALASTLPRIEIPVGGRKITLVPFAKSVGPNSGDVPIDGTEGVYQPTNQIVDFYVESIDATSGKFRVNFEDVEQGADHDMDAIALYEYKVVGGEVEVTVTSQYAAGSIIQHMGYVISGTKDRDGAYLVIRDHDTAANNDIDYFLDTPATFTGTPPYSGWQDSQALPHTSTRTFEPGSTDGATVLKDPLWYAAKWGGFTEADDDKNDAPDQPTEWDADGNGTPDNYFLVTNALKLSDQLRDAFDRILRTTSSASAVATNSTRLDTDTLIYQARFLSGDWTGQLLAYKINTDGSLQASPQWDAADPVNKMPAHNMRKIFTRNGTLGVPFAWASLNAAQQTYLNTSSGGVADGKGQDRLAWLRGDQSGEQKNLGGTFRNRSVVLGDIINSDPVFVGTQNFGYESLPPATPGQNTYAAFRAGKFVANVDGLLVAKAPMIYVGANDGMVHGFDAATGIEQFAYVPSTLFPELSKLTSPTYKHRYYVDGQMFAGDAYIGGDWKTVLVGTLGAGGKTVYALDVTNPSAFDETKVMWEFTDADLGHVIGQPTIARMADGTWVAVFGNGYNSTNHRAVLYIVRLSDGTLLKKIDTGVGTLAVPNGLATPALVADGTRTIRSIYAGDLYGNLWKFDVSTTSETTWGSAYMSGVNPAPLFVAKDSAGVTQPITAPLEIGRHPQGGYMIYFGTGKFFETQDNVVGANPQVQTFYGIWDKQTSPSAITADRATALVEQEILYEGKPSNSHFDTRVTSNYSVDWSTKRGWYIDLLSPRYGAESERVVSSPIVRAGRVIFPTLIPPTDPCSDDGGSWLMELAAVSGSRLEQPPLDINEDGQIDAADQVTVTLPDGTTVLTNVPVSGVLSRQGIIDTPAIITAGSLEYKLASGTSGNLEVLRERGLFDRARGSWRQLR